MPRVVESVVKRRLDRYGRDRNAVWMSRMDGYDGFNVRQRRAISGNAQGDHVNGPGLPMETLTEARG